MAVTKDQLLNQALSMNKRERELLALELWRSLDDTTQEEVWDAWAIEIARRMKALEHGEVETIPAEQVLREARKLVRKKRTT